MKKKEATSLITFMAVVVVGFSLIRWAIAGSLNPAAGPESSAGGMHTLADIYNRLTGNAVADKRGGPFAEPTAAPVPTGYSLDEIYDVAIPTQVPKSGQTASSLPGDDGDLEKGVPWPGTRFTDNGDGTVTDNLTGLVWLKDAECFGLKIWPDALSSVSGLAHNACDGSLADGSQPGDWRLPNIKELLSLIDYGESYPALPDPHPFQDVQMEEYSASYEWIGDIWDIVNNPGYWTGTNWTGTNGPTSTVWTVNMYYGLPVLRHESTENSYSWPVRDAN